MTRTQPAILITGTVDPSPTGDITDLLAIKDGDGTLQLTIYGEPYPVIILDAEDLAALTNLLNQGAKPQLTSATYAGATLLFDLQPEPAQMGARAACTQALEHIEAIDTLLDIIWPDHNIAATAEEYLSGLLTMLQTRLTAIEDNLIMNHKSPITSPHNATLPEQEDAPS